MSRARNIKPGFFKNDRLAECEPLARILFAGLWCEADREGRLEDRPKRLKVECLPYDECDADALLAQLERGGFIERYKVESSQYIQILEFTKHQNPHCKESASTIPASGKHGASTVQAPDKHRTGPADSPSLIPDSPSLKQKKATDHRADDRARIESDFSTWWSCYPRKVGKENARKAFVSLKPDPQTVERMVRAVQEQAACEQWRRDGGQFIPHPATWINGKRWLDEQGANVAPINGRIAL